MQKFLVLTTGLAVMKINSELGYEPVTYSELTQDEAFWAGCKSCVNYEILMSKERKIVCVLPCCMIQKIITSRKKQKNSLKRIKVGLNDCCNSNNGNCLRKKIDNGNGGGNSSSKLKSFLFHFFNF